MEENKEKKNIEEVTNPEGEPEKKKSRGKIILALVGFALFIIVATLLYQNLSEKYLQSGNINTNESDGAVKENPDTDTGNSEDKPDNENGSDNPEIKEITFLDAQGNQVRLSDKLGKPIILNFWTSWCPYCVEEMPYFQSIYDEKGAEVNFLMVNVTDGSRETKEIGIEFIEKKGFTFPTYYDVRLEASNFYSVHALPTTVFLDENGREVSRTSGKISEEDLRSQIDKLLQ